MFALSLKDLILNPMIFKFAAIASRLLSSSPIILDKIQQGVVVGVNRVHEDFFLKSGYPAHLAEAGFSEAWTLCIKRK